MPGRRLPPGPSQHKARPAAPGGRRRATRSNPSQRGRLPAAVPHAWPGAGPRRTWPRPGPARAPRRRRAHRAPAPGHTASAAVSLPDPRVPGGRGAPAVAPLPTLRQQRGQAAFEVGRRQRLVHPGLGPDGPCYGARRGSSSSDPTRWLTTRSSALRYLLSSGGWGCDGSSKSCRMPWRISGALGASRWRAESLLPWRGTADSGPGRRSAASW